MKKLLFILILSVVAAAACHAQAATSGEMGLASKIRSAEFVPFSFTLGGEPSATVLARSERTVSSKATEAGVTETTTVWSGCSSQKRRVPSMMSSAVYVIRSFLSPTKRS